MTRKSYFRRLHLMVRRLRVGTEIELSHHRRKRRGGGIALYVLGNVKHIVRRDSEEDFEVIWIEMRLNKVKCFIGCVYRALDESPEVFDYLDDVMRHATNNNLKVIVIGHLNCDINKTSRPTERLPEFAISNELE